MTEPLRDAVQRFWDARPCGVADVPSARVGTQDGFLALDARRYSLEPFIEAFAGFDKHAGQRVLEVGCGAGADLMRFARGGARTAAVDLSSVSLRLTRRRMEVLGFSAALSVGDAERLPLPDASFDLVYSWGVLHHAPDPARAVAEVHRVLMPGGIARVMLYHRRSLFALQAWVRYALLSGRPWRGLGEVLAAHVESPGTRAYTVAEVRRLFASVGFVEIGVETVLTAWDARVGRRRFLPPWCRALLPARWGWFLLISARRPAA